MAEEPPKWLTDKVDEHSEKLAEHHTRLVVLKNNTAAHDKKFDRIDKEIAVNTTQVLAEITNLGEKLHPLTTDYNQREGAKKIFRLWIIPVLSVLVAAAAIILA